MYKLWKCVQDACIKKKTSPALFPIKPHSSVPKRTDVVLKAKGRHAKYYVLLCTELYSQSLMHRNISFQYVLRRISFTELHVLGSCCQLYYIKNRNRIIWYETASGQHVKKQNKKSLKPFQQMHRTTALSRCFIPLCENVFSFFFLFYCHFLSLKVIQRHESLVRDNAHRCLLPTNLVISWWFRVKHTHRSKNLNKVQSLKKRSIDYAESCLPAGVIQRITKMNHKLRTSAFLFAILLLLHIVKQHFCLWQSLSGNIMLPNINL